jgi:endonuclease IV
MNNIIDLEIIDDLFNDEYVIEVIGKNKSNEEVKVKTKNEVSKLILGVHINKDNSLLENIKLHHKELNINCCQIFVVGPRNTKQNNIEINEIAEYIKENNIILFIHSNYVSNIWYSDEEYKVKVDKDKCDYQMGVKINELKISDTLNSVGIVLHISSVDIKQVESSLNRFALLMIENNIKSQLIIEMSACKPTEHTYETSIKLNKLGNLLHKINTNYNKILFTICIDTSHIWAGGVDISSYVKARDYFNELSPITTKLLSIIHFNSNTYKLGSGKDTHQRPFESDDAIWYEYNEKRNESGIKFIIEFVIKNKIPLLCERHNHDTTSTTLKDELTDLRNLI